MVKFRLSGVMVMSSLFLLSFLGVSCVNEEYDMSEDNLNLEVTPFEDGLTLPLGSTDPIKLKELLKDVGSDILGTGENGAYSISFNDSFDMTDQLSSLKDLVDIPDVEFSQKVVFQMNDVDVSDVKVEAQDYAFEHDLSASVNVPDVTMPAVTEKIEVAAGLNDYAPSASDMLIDMAAVEHDMEFMSLSDAADDLGGLVEEDTPLSLEDDMFADYLATSVEFEVKETVGMNISLPKGINSVDQIVLSDKAAIKVSMELVNSFLYSGALVPDVDLDLSKIFHLKGITGGVAHLEDDFRLTEDNNYKQSVVYYIDSLAVTSADWSRKDADSPYVLDKEFAVEAGGDILFEDLMTTVNLIRNCKNIDVKLVIEFVDLEIADVVMGIDPVEIAQENTVPMSMDNLEIPDAIESLGGVTFAAGSGIDIVVKAQNADKVRGLDLGLETLAITFPKALAVEGADADNKIVIADVDLAKGVEKHVNITGLTLPEAVDGKISFNENIEVKAVANAAGKVHSADLPSSAANDVKVLVNVESSLEVADYQVKMAGYDYALEIEPEVIKVEIPEALADLDEIVIYPEGTPVVNISFDIPELALDVTPSVEGLNISFPEIMKFKELPSSYNYDLATNSITLKGSFPAEVSLPVDKLVLKPVQDPADGKYYAEGEVNVKGGVSLAAGTLNKADVESLSNAGKIAVVAHVPELVPSSLALDRFETSIREEVELDLLSAEDMPKELVAVNVIELNDTYINISLDASKLPVGDAQLTVDLAVDLPDMIKVSGADADGNIRLSGKIDDKGMIVIDPVKVEALDLTGKDISKGIKDVIVIDGTVALENAAIDVDEWLGKDLEIGFNAGITDIDIEKVSGKVDYQVDPVVESVDLSDFASAIGDMGAEANFDFNHAHLAIEVATNLGVPIKGEVVLVPYYDGKPDAGKTVNVSLGLEPSATPAKEEFTRLWLANNDDRCPSNYKFVEADILGLLKQIPEKLEFRLDAGTDPDEDSVLEPSADYTLKANYNFELPLEFGEEFEITYRDTISDMPEILGSLLAKGSKVKLGGEIINSLPLALDLRLNFLDSNGNVVPLAEGCGVQRIAPCNLDASASATPLEIVLAVKEGVNADIASLELMFNANSAGVAGIPVTEDAYLQAVLQLVLPEGITVDLKDIMKE